MRVFTLIIEKEYNEDEITQEEIKKALTDELNVFVNLFEQK